MVDFDIELNELIAKFSGGTTIDTMLDALDDAVMNLETKRDGEGGVVAVLPRSPSERSLPQSLQRLQNGTSAVPPGRASRT